MEMNWKNKTLFVKIAGDMDHYNVGIMRSEIDKAIREKPVTHLVFDLSDLEFMDSSGIGLILGRYKKIKSFEGNVFIAGAKPAVEKVINLSGLHKIIPLIDTAERAEKTVCGVSK